MKSSLLALALFLLMGLPLMAQVGISGTVSDDAGPMIGTSIVEKGTVQRDR
jgi:hypothetical protein